MTSPFAPLLPLAWQSLRDPREAAAAVLALPVPRTALVPAGLLVVVLSAIFSVLAGLLVASPPEAEVEVEFFSPIMLAALLGGTLLAYMVALHRIGRALGGRGSFEETARLMILLQFVILGSQIAEIVLIFVAPGLVGLFVVAVAVFALWINVNFVAVLHEFPLLKALGLILLVSLVLAVIGLFLASALGLNAGSPA